MPLIFKGKCKEYLALLRAKDSLHDSKNIVRGPGQDEH